MHYLGLEEGDNYQAIKGIVTYMHERYNILNDNFTTIDSMWDIMKEGEDKP